MEPILVILAVLAVALIAGTFYVVNRTTGRRGPDLEPPSRGGVLAPPRPEGGVVVEERPPVTEPEVLEPEVLEPEVVEPEVVAPVRKPSLRDRLAKARSTFAGFLGRTRIDEETWDELEEALIRADLGVGPTTELLDQLRARVKDEGLETGEQLVEALKTEMKAQLQVSDRALRLDDGRTNVWLFVGVNGVGKTTTIGKLGKRLVGDGHQVVMAAGDTFRAAAAEQLETWAGRAGADLVRGAEGADPSAIIFDAIESAAARTPTWCSPTPRAGSTPRPTSWRSCARCAGWPTRTRATSPRSCS